VIGGLLLLVNQTAGVALLAFGGCLLVIMPFVAAIKGAESHFHPDHKVEGRTFVIDLWRSTAARADRDRAQAVRDRQRARSGRSD
jgi:hypothetical protein